MSSNKKSDKKFIGGLAVAFLLPLTFYLITAQFSKGKIQMPRHYGVESTSTHIEDGKTVYDTVYKKMPELTLTNQLGEQVSLNKDLPGKILVVDFFFASCPDVCPKLTTNMGMLQKAYKRNKKSETGFDTTIQLISITVDPQRDSFSALRNYANRFNVNHDKWWFLTGDKKLIYDYARNQLGVAVNPGDGGAEDFIHTEKMVLIDKDRYIRGYYNGLDSADVKKCADDIILLSLEKKKEKK